MQLQLGAPPMAVPKCAVIPAQPADQRNGDANEAKCPGNCIADLMPSLDSSVSAFNRRARVPFAVNAAERSRRSGTSNNCAYVGYKVVP
jgi:hypothetical protein